ncbi:HPr kinase/phosphorylase [Marivita sp. S0852]|uniref:HPr kinase/phosphorylase n=1 Tax=Marivita sp. S0852 TaxID=3373893 RepID=UPI00398209CD
MTDAAPLTLHATAVAVAETSVLLIGSSGSGKSALALEMMARGATLIADDQVILTSRENAIYLTCPAPLEGLIEARGVGLLHTDHVSDVPLALVVDMDQEETERLPPKRTTTFLGKSLPLLHNVASGHFPAALIQYLRHAHRNDAHL